MKKAHSDELQRKLGGEGSLLKRYRTTVVGDGGNLHLAFYELINLLFMPMKGRTGIVFRRYLLPFLLSGAGRNFSCGANCTIRNGKRIVIGDHAVIDDEVTLDVKTGDNWLIIGADVHVGKKTIFNCNGEKIEIGAGTKIGPFCRIGSLKGLSIGQHCTMGEQSCISGASHSFSRIDTPIIKQPLTCKGWTEIGDFVKIGDRVTILDGIKIGNNVSILDGSLVNKDIADGMVVSGVPAKVVA